MPLPHRQKRLSIRPRLPKSPTDIQAIIKVIGRREETQRAAETNRVDLPDTNLRRARLQKRTWRAPSSVGQLDSAALNEAHLEGASLRGATGLTQEQNRSNLHGRTHVAGHAT